MSAAFSGYMQQEPPVVIAMKAYRETRVSQPSLWNHSESALKSLLWKWSLPSWLLSFLLCNQLMYSNGSSQTFPLKSQWMDVKTMNKKVTKWWPLYCGVQGATTRKAKEEKKARTSLSSTGCTSHNRAIFRVPTTASQLHHELTQVVTNQEDTWAGFLESWHSDSLDFYRLHASPHPPIYKRKIIVVINLSWELHELLCVRLLVKILTSGKGWLWSPPSLSFPCVLSGNNS